MQSCAECGAVMDVVGGQVACPVCVQERAKGASPAEPELWRLRGGDFVTAPDVQDGGPTADSEAQRDGQEAARRFVMGTLGGMLMFALGTVLFVPAALSVVIAVHDRALGPGLFGGGVAAVGVLAFAQSVRLRRRTQVGN